MRILLAAYPTVGHTQALRMIGMSLADGGHTIHFASTRVPTWLRFFPIPEPLVAALKIRGALEQAEFDLIEVPPSLRGIWLGAQIAKKKGYDELAVAAQLFTCDLERTARQLVQEIRARQIDVVAADFSFLGAWLAAELTDTPFAAVYHSGLPFPADGHPPFGSRLAVESDPASWDTDLDRLDRIAAQTDSTLMRARQALGLAPIASRILERPYATALNLLTTHEVFEAPRPDLAQQAAGPLLWAGPCLGTRAAEQGDFPWERIDRKKPAIYISLGTVFNNEPQVFATLLNAVHAVNAQAVVAAGAAHNAVQAIASDQDIVVRYAPQVALLPQMAAVIGHGGQNSTNETLMAGKPLLVVPFGAEQGANGQRVVALGVGRTVDSDALIESEVVQSLQWLLEEQTQQRAEHLASQAPTSDGTALAAVAIEALGSTSEKSQQSYLR